MKTKPLIPQFIPTTPSEVKLLGWSDLDIILITGDTYIDASYMGVSVIGKVLLHAGFRVGIIAQPDISSDKDITRLGEPTLFWGVSAGCVDSMIANYTASGKKRKKDDMTPGGVNNRRPDRAIIAYSNLIRRFFKKTKPIVLGGIEASLRRISHYDDKSNSIRRSVLFDAKANILVYGMAEQSVLELAENLKNQKGYRDIRGICYISPEVPEESEVFEGSDVVLPSHKRACSDNKSLITMFQLFYDNADPISAKRLYQQQDTRYLVQNPPQRLISTDLLDKIYEIPYARDVHPFYKKQGEVRALSTFRFSLTTHRGCYGECRFCAIAVHQGRHVISRSSASILREAKQIAAHPKFKGQIADVGGPTANMYGFECSIKKKKGACKRKSCIFPVVCRHLPVNHQSQLQLLQAIREIPNVRNVFIASGIRYDLILIDPKYGKAYVKTLFEHHVSGQLKIAPEHSESAVLDLMGKPQKECLNQFIHLFNKQNTQSSKKIFLTYYMMAAHPGCTLHHMQSLRKFASQKLKLLPKQTQIFTPSPSTYSTLMYCTGIDPFTGDKIFVEKQTHKKEKQKQTLLKK